MSLSSGFVEFCLTLGLTMEGNSSGSHASRHLPFPQVDSDFLHVLSHWGQRKNEMGMLMVPNIAMMGHTQSTQPAEVRAMRSEQDQSAHYHGLPICASHSGTRKATVSH